MRQDAASTWFMQMQPTQQTESPWYSTQDEFRPDAEQIVAHVPPRWRKMHGLLGAAAAVLAVQLGVCAAQADRSEPPVPAAASPLVEKAAMWTKGIFCLYASDQDLPFRQSGTGLE
jgi:hypothetical protein